MSSPLKFNDPFDCSVSINIGKLTSDQVSIIKKNERIRKELHSVIETFEITDDIVFAALLEKIAYKTLNKSKEDFLKSYGVCCFSEVNDDLLMWGHYGEGFKGFCLEFRTDYEPFTNFHKVAYKDSMPTINTYELLVNTDPSFIYDLYCTKSARWSYEREWRILHKEAGTLFCYDSNCLKAIYFGPRIEFEFSEILCLILQNQNPQVEIYFGQLTSEKFGIEFSKVNYIPFNKAKALGLRP